MAMAKLPPLRVVTLFMPLGFDGRYRFSRVVRTTGLDILNFFWPSSCQIRLAQ